MNAVMKEVVADGLAENLVICTTVSRDRKFTALIADAIPDLHLIGDSQCFPLFLYEARESE